jgi:hypothetical protein
LELVALGHIAALLRRASFGHWGNMLKGAADREPQRL